MFGKTASKSWNADPEKVDPSGKNRKWEYKLVARPLNVRPGKTRENTGEKFNELDAKGWRFVDSFNLGGNTYNALFRRPFGFGRDDDATAEGRA